MSKTQRLILIVGFCALLAFFDVGCHSSESAKPSAHEITVSAAASLQDAFREIGKQFEAQTGARVNFNFAASGTLQKQIESGAPVDVFASAGHTQMDALAAQRLIAPETRQDFARNELVLIAPAEQTVELKSFADLNNTQIKRIAIGNPKTVPAGQYAQQTLTHFNLWTPLQSRLVLGEDVRQALDYVTRGEVEAGIVYASDVRARDGAVQIVARAPADSHEPIAYPIAVIRASKQPDVARAFLDAVMSDEGQRSLEKYGYESVKDQHD
ncbi:MAG: molybdate ABC transporter substrate-binding protein [Acidobacteria bacterium]|nr:molybdate ABC transporter substrate-binding protein [Acidobacteriota bacterium]